MTYPVMSSPSAATSGRPGAISAVAAASNMPRPVGSRPIPVFLPAEQLYYWTYAWQSGEAKALHDLREGRARNFDDPRAAVSYLLGTE